MAQEQIISEDRFQKWVEDRFRAQLGHVCDLSMVGGFVPDLSVAVRKRDYWLELKFGVFQLLHSRYDDFKFDTLTRGQLQWLDHRSRASKAMCGVLGYCKLEGDGGYHGVDYLFFMTAKDYLRRLWQKKVNAGGVILSNHCRLAEMIKTGDALQSFIDDAARGAARNDE